LPGASELFSRMDQPSHSSVAKPVITIYEISDATDPSYTAHKFPVADASQLLLRWDVMHGIGLCSGTRKILHLDGLDASAIKIVDDALGLHPSVFIRHLWRSANGEGGFSGIYPSQTPLYRMVGSQRGRVIWKSGLNRALTQLLDKIDINGLDDAYHLFTWGSSL
jgi:hypothetical protein